MKIANILWPAAWIALAGFIICIIGNFWNEGDTVVARVGFWVLGIGVVPLVLAALYYGARSLFGKADQ